MPVKYYNLLINKILDFKNINFVLTRTIRIREAIYLLLREKKI